MAVPPTTSKALMRESLRQRRQAFVSGIDLRALSHAMAELAEPAVPPGQTVAAYHAIGDEIDPLPLLHTLARRGVIVALPHVSGRRDAMRFLTWQPDSPLEPGPFGLLQPPADAAELAPGIIFAPLLGFDSALNRIGYGAGHYDRAFARFPDARRIGLAWSVQRCDMIPVDEWDVSLHAVVTEKSWIEK